MSELCFYSNYQPSWFACSISEYYDLDSKRCVSSWDSDKIAISDNNLSNLDKYCRGLNYYIDPYNIEPVEIGTEEFPYRTIAPVFAEILKHMSHSNLTISIWVKEGTTLMIEESQIFILNITEISLSTYSSSSDLPGYATLVSTDSAVEGLSKKAALNIIKSVDVDLTDAISKGDFTSYELESLGRTGDTFQVWRTSISFSNFIVKRISDTLHSGLFLFPLYFQDKVLTLSKNKFNI